MKKNINIPKKKLILLIEYPDSDVRILIKFPGMAPLELLLFDD